MTFALNCSMPLPIKKDCCPPFGLLQFSHHFSSTIFVGISSVPNEPLSIRCMLAPSPTGWGMHPQPVPYSLTSCNEAGAGHTTCGQLQPTFNVHTPFPSVEYRNSSTW